MYMYQAVIDEPPFFVIETRRFDGVADDAKIVFLTRHSTNWITHKDGNNDTLNSAYRRYVGNINVGYGVGLTLKLIIQQIRSHEKCQVHW